MYIYIYLYISCYLFEESKTESLFAVVIAGVSAYCFDLSTYTSLRCMPFEVVSLSPFSRRSSILFLLLLLFGMCEQSRRSCAIPVRFGHTHTHIQKHTEMKRERETERQFVKHGKNLKKKKGNNKQTTTSTKRTSCKTTRLARRKEREERKKRLRCHASELPTLFKSIPENT